MNNWSLPGLEVGGAAAGPRPVAWDGHGHRLLSGARLGGAVPPQAHLTQWGPLPGYSLEQLALRAQHYALLGAGGAAFPVHRKLRAMMNRRVGTVVINGAEGETCSGKDQVLLRHVPQLVLDGAELVVRATGCRRIVLRLSPGPGDTGRQMEHAIAARNATRSRGERLNISLSVGPDSFVAGEASAVVNGLFTGNAVPTGLGVPPRQPRRRAYVYLSNVETYARLAVAARGIDPGSALISLSGATQPRVTERAPTLRFAELLPFAQPHDIVITGGWHGAWLRAARLLDTQLTPAAVAAHGGRWGAGAFVLVPSEQAVAALIAVSQFLAQESAGRCGPCRLGLPQLAGLAARGDLEGARALAAEIGDRGACGHPSATSSAVVSALECVYPQRLQRSVAA
ncbi:MAG: hypothetical protein KDC39_13865 [Actinobacteria bacterium]|nr:hypothetical protein [Actinomycetota bacterium]